MQENRSFDTYFGTFPGADGIPMANGVSRRFAFPNPRHGECVAAISRFATIATAAARTARERPSTDIDGGKMDGFIARCAPTRDARAATRTHRTAPAVAT